MSFFKQLTQTIKQYDKIIIKRHIRPDADALGAQLGLAEIIKDNFQKDVYCPGQASEFLSFLGELDIVEPQLYDDALVIVVDTPIINRTDDNKLPDKNRVIKIDHHPFIEEFAQLEYVDTSASSASEIIASYALSENLIISDRSAYLLYAGIIGDTGRFLFPSTTTKTFEIVAQLRKREFDAAQLANKMSEKSLKVARFSGYIMQQMSVSDEGVCAIVVTQDDLKTFDITHEETGALVSIPGSIDTVKVWVVCIEQDDGTYRCRLRSKGIVINELAMRYHGGGHPLASGATAQNDGEVQTLITELKEIVKQ